MAALMSKWDTQDTNDLIACTAKAKVDNVHQDHTCPADDGTDAKKALRCGKLTVTKKEPAEGDTPKEYAHICVFSDDCGQSITLEDGTLGISCSAVKMMTAAVAALTVASAM